MTDDLVTEARLDAKAFRENTVYDSEGDPIRLIANADRLDRYADRIEALTAEVKRLRDGLGHAVGIIEAHVDRDALGKNGDPETGMWPLLDEYLHHFRAALRDEA